MRALANGLLKFQREMKSDVGNERSSNESLSYSQSRVYTLMKVRRGLE